LGLTIAVALTLCAVPAIAQLTPLLTDRDWSGLTADDINRVHIAELRLFEGRSIGTIERWRNPDTGNAGEIELVRKYDAKGLPCRRVNYAIRFAEEATALKHYVLNWCRQPSGDWKIVPDGPPA
jgi:surface antigen